MSDTQNVIPYRSKVLEEGVMHRVIKGILTSSIILLLVGCSADLTDAQYVEKAQGYYEKGELKAAAIELKNALIANQRNAGARRLLGLIHLRLGDAAGAEKELRRARELGIADDAVLPDFARALIAQSKFDEMQKLSMAGLSLKSSRAIVLAAKGKASLAQGEIKRAEEQITQALLWAPEEPYVHVAKAYLLSAENKLGPARVELDKALKLDAGYAPAWGVKGDVDKRQGNYADAEAAYTKAVNNSLANTVYRLKRAQVLVKEKKLELAQKDVDALKKVAPHNPEVNYLQGRIYFSNKRYAEAKDSFESALKADGQHKEAIYFLAQSNLALGSRESATDYARRFLALMPGSIAGRKLMAALEISDQHYKAAERLIRPVVDFQSDDAAALNLLASALLPQGKTDEGIELLRKVVDLRPDLAYARLRLGGALLAAKKEKEGLENVRKAIEMDPESEQADLVLVRYYLVKNDLPKALATANAYQSRHPNSVTPGLIIGLIRLQSGHQAQAIKAFRHVLDLDPGNIGASHVLAGIAVRNKDFKQARDYLQGVLARHQDNLGTLMRLAVLARMENNENQMREYLERASKSHPTAIGPQAVLARYYLVKGQPDKVATLMLQLSKAQKATPDILAVRALSAFAQRQYANARSDFESLVKATPNYAWAHYMLAKTYAQLGNAEGSVAELEKTLELEPKHYYARVALARILLSQGKRERAAELIASFREEAPQQPDVLALKAALAQAEGNKEVASKYLEEAFSKMPTTDTMLDMALQKWAQSGPDSAKGFVEKWLSEHPDDIRAAMAVAAIYDQKNDIDNAIAQYKDILEKDPQNVDALNSLAWYLRARDPRKALEYAEQANELAPDYMPALDTLAMVLLENGDVIRARRTIARALQKSPDDPIMLYHSAQIANAAGDQSAARRVLEQLLGRGVDFPQKDEARKLMKELGAK